MVECIHRSQGGSSLFSDSAGIGVVVSERGKTNDAIQLCRLIAEAFVGEPVLPKCIHPDKSERTCPVATQGVIPSVGQTAGK